MQSVEWCPLCQAPLPKRGTFTVQLRGRGATFRYGLRMSTVFIAGNEHLHGKRSGPALKRVTHVCRNEVVLCIQKEHWISQPLTWKKKAVILLRRHLAQALVCHISIWSHAPQTKLLRRLLRSPGAHISSPHPKRPKCWFSERSNVLLRWNKDDSCLGATAVGAGTLQTFTVSWTISVRSWRTAVCIRKHAGICILKEFQKQVAYSLQLFYCWYKLKAKWSPDGCSRQVLMLSRHVIWAIEVEPEKTREALLSWVASIFFITKRTDWCPDWCRDMSWCRLFKFNSWGHLPGSIMPSTWSRWEILNITKCMYNTRYVYMICHI